MHVMQPAELQNVTDMHTNTVQKNARKYWSKALYKYCTKILHKNTAQKMHKNTAQILLRECDACSRQDRSILPVCMCKEGLMCAKLNVETQCAKIFCKDC